MTKLTQYAVYRTGSNAANQPMTQEVFLALATAYTAEDACDKVRSLCKLDACRENHPTVYNNQRLWAKPASKVSKRDLQELLEADAMRDASYLECR